MPQLGGPVNTSTALGGPARSVARLFSSAARLKKASLYTAPPRASPASPALATSAPPRGAGCSAVATRAVRVRPWPSGKVSHEGVSHEKRRAALRAARQPRTASAAWKRASCCVLRGRTAQTGRARVTDAGATARSCGARQPRGSAAERMLSAAAQLPPCAAALRAPRRVARLLVSGGGGGVGGERPTHTYAQGNRETSARAGFSLVSKNFNLPCLQCLLRVRACESRTK